MDVVSLALLILTAVQGPAVARTPTPPRFFARVEHDVGGKPEFLAAGDVDGDGRADLVVALQSPGELLVARGTDPDPFVAPERIPLGGYPLRPQLVRWSDGDATVRTVVAVASRADKKLVIVDLARGGEPRILVERALPAAPLAIAAAGLGATTDAVCVALDDHELVVQQGTRELERRKNALRGDLPRCLSVSASRTLVGFQNLDALDILGAKSTRTIDLGGLARDITPCTLALVHGFAVASGDDDVRWWSDDNTTPTTIHTGPIPVRILASPRGDELATLSYAGDACEIWRARRTHDVLSLTRSASLYAGQTPTDMAIGDFDGDSKPDLAIANRDAQRVSILTGTDDTFRSAPRTHVGSFPSRVRALHSGTHTAALVVLDAKEAALSLLTPASATWNETQRLPIDPPPLLLSCADLDADGVDEVVLLSNATNIASLRVFSFIDNRLVPRALGGTTRWTGSPTEILLDRAAGATTLFYVDADHNRLGRARIVANAQHELAIQDATELELAGAPDALALLREPNRPDRLAVTASARSKLLIIPIDEPTRIESELDCSGLPLDVRAADFDGDGILDLAVLARADTHSMQGRVQLFRGDGKRFTPSTVLTTGLSAFHLACADLDGDNLADILVPAQDSHCVDLFWSRSAPGAIAFERRPALGAGLGCIDVTATNLDADDHLDLVVANSSSDDVSILTNTTPH